MYLLGAHLADNKVVKVALTAFYGINLPTAERLCARLQIHDRATVGSLTEHQVTALSAYLSSPGSVAAQAPRPLSHISPPSRPLPSSSKGLGVGAESQTSYEAAVSLPGPSPSTTASPSDDPLRSLSIETDLRRQVRANIAHHRSVGSYIGRRHSLGYPVRGQGTRTNARTARRLNRLDRRGFASVSALVEPLARLRFRGETA